MPGTLPLGSSDWIRCNLCLHERTDALSQQFLRMRIDPTQGILILCACKFEVGTCLRLIFL